MSQFENDPLAQRLAGLALPMPAALTARVLSAAHTRPIRIRTRRPLWATVSMAAALIVVAVLGASYAAPRFQAALADTPLLGSTIAPLLRGLGLEPLSTRFQPVTAVANSSGREVRLVAAYTDENDTFLILQMTPPVTWFPGIATLTDQFGRTVEIRGGETQADGNTLVNFAGVGWPDTLLGARLTLRMRTLNLGPETSTVLPGDWTLHATIATEPARPYAHPLPADGHLDNSTIHVTRVQATAATVHVEMAITGPLAKKLDATIGQAVPNVSKPRPAFVVRLLAADGTEVQALQSQGGSSLTGADFSMTWLRPAAARYRLLITYEGIGQIERQLDLS